MSSLQLTDGTIKNVPEAIYAEVAILATMIWDVVAIHDAVSVLQAEDFFLDSHKRIYAAILRMSTEGRGVDPITLRGELQRTKELDAVGGLGYLSDLSGGLNRVKNIEGYVQMVQDKATARRGIQTCLGAIEALQAADCDASEVIGRMTRILTEDQVDTTKTIQEVIPRALRALEPQHHVVIPTGIRDLDESLAGGLRTKELVIIGAQPSAGKSALARQIERRAVKANFGIHAMSIEVSDERWTQHHIFRLAGVPAWKIRKPDMRTEQDMWHIEEAATLMNASWNYRIDDVGAMNTETLLAKARLSALRYGTKVFTIDYLQLLITDESNTHREMSRAAKKLKQFAKDYDVAVIALSQLKRGGDINKRPTVQDLKESGDLEAAADVVILNYRPKDLETGHYTGEDELIIGKQREGDVGTLLMHFDPDTLTFGRRPA